MLEHVLIGKVRTLCRNMLSASQSDIRSYDLQTFLLHQRGACPFVTRNVTDFGRRSTMVQSTPSAKPIEVHY